MLIYYVCLFTAILIGVAGQVALKTGTLSVADSSGIPLFQPYVILGLGCYFASALFYIFALKKIPVSIAFPSVSMSYVAVAIIAHLLWNEPFGSYQMIAIAFILTGVFLLVRA
ncbi:MAG TPA: EamA family transporter [Gammaproteobacteria bacterium]|nr:EamA family transporter [Gammaproteobacteria bacterium]